MLTRYGTDNIVIMLIISMVLIGLAFAVEKPWAVCLLSTAGILLALFTFWFFRDPERKVNSEAAANQSIVVSPADGTVVEIIDEDENKFFGTKAKRISIFLSPLDVHVNRIPVSGTVKYFEYKPGEYLIANHPKSSELNEQSIIGLETQFGKVLFKQIVGVVARRLVCELKEGDTVTKGDKFGMMKFGSRMDVVVNQSSKVLVNIGDKVKACESILADINCAK